MDWEVVRNMEGYANDFTPPEVSDHQLKSGLHGSCLRILALSLSLSSLYRFYACSSGTMFPWIPFLQGFQVTNSSYLCISEFYAFRRSRLFLDVRNATRQRILLSVLIQVRLCGQPRTSLLFVLCSCFQPIALRPVNTFSYDFITLESLQKAFPSLVCPASSLNHVYM